MKLYHYSATKFKAFDAARCDGIWLTTITPKDTDLLDEIGAAGLSFVAVCEVNADGDSLVNGDNYDVVEQLKESGCDYIENICEEFTDYAFADDCRVKIIGWEKL